MVNNDLLYKHVNSLRKVKQSIHPLPTSCARVERVQDAVNALRLQYAPIFQYRTCSCYIQSVALTPPVFTHVTFSPSIVLRKLPALRDYSSTGSDNIKPKALKTAATKLAEPLSQIFQRCFDEHHVPADCKPGIITPIFKGGSRSDATNYRPVTLLPVLSKVMETIVAEALVDHLEKANFLAPEQHGFRQNISCTFNLLMARGGWTEAVDHGDGVDVIDLFGFLQGI